MNSHERIRVVIAVDHNLLQLGLGRFFESNADMLLVGEIYSGEELVQVIEHGRPDIFLVDWNMPRLDGIDALQQMKRDYPQIPMIILIGENDLERLNTTLSAGADIYLPKSVSTDQLAATIRSMGRPK